MDTRSQGQIIERFIRRALEVKRLQSSKKTDQSQPKFIRETLRKEAAKEEAHTVDVYKFIAKRKMAITNLEVALDNANDIANEQKNKIKSLIMKLENIQQGFRLKEESLMYIKSLINSDNGVEIFVGKLLQDAVNKLDRKLDKLDDGESAIKENQPIVNIDYNGASNYFFSLKSFLELSLDDDDLASVFNIIGGSAKNILQNGNFNDYAEVIVLITDAIEIVGAGTESEALKITSFDRSKIEKKWNQLSIVKALSHSVSEKYDIYENHGLVQKILKNESLSGHYLADDEIRLFINTYAPQQAIHIGVKNVDDIKQIAERERSKHEADEAYVFYIMLNNARSRSEQGNHWTSARIVVDPVTKKLGIQYADSAMCWTVPPTVPPVLVKGISEAFSGCGFKGQKGMQDDVVRQPEGWECGYLSLYHIFRHLGIDSPLSNWSPEKGFLALRDIVQKAILKARRFDANDKNFKDCDINVVLENAGDNESKPLKFREAFIDEKFVSKKTSRMHARQPSHSINELPDYALKPRVKSESGQSERENAATDPDDQTTSSESLPEININQQTKVSGNSGNNKRKVRLPKNMPFNDTVTECKALLAKYSNSHQSLSSVDSSYDDRVLCAQQLGMRLINACHDHDLELVLHDVKQKKGEMVFSHPKSELIGILATIQTKLETLLNPAFRKKTDTNADVLYQQLFDHLKSVDTLRTVTPSEYSWYGRELLLKGCKDDDNLTHNTGRHTLKDELIGKLYFIKTNSDMDKSTKCAEMRRVKDQLASSIATSSYGKPSVYFGITWGEGSRLLRALSFFGTTTNEPYKANPEPVKPYIHTYENLWTQSCISAGIKYKVLVDRNGIPDDRASKKEKNQIQVEAALYLLSDYKNEWGANHKPFVMQALQELEKKKANLTVKSILKYFSAHLRTKICTANDKKNWNVINPDGSLMRRLNYIAWCTGNTVDICMVNDADAKSTRKINLR